MSLSKLRQTGSLAFGKLTESELEEIKREAAQDGKPGSGFLSAMTGTTDHSSVQISATDKISELLVDDSVATTSIDSVTPPMASAEMATGACLVNDAKGS